MVKWLKVKVTDKRSTFRRGRRQEAGSRRQEAGAGDWKQEMGSRRQETGGRKQDAGGMGQVGVGQEVGGPVANGWCADVVEFWIKSSVSHRVVFVCAKHFSLAFFSPP